MQFYIALNYSTVGHPAKAMEDIKVCVGVTVCLTDHVLKVQMRTIPSNPVWGSWTLVY